MQCNCNTFAQGRSGIQLKLTDVSTSNIFYCIFIWFHSYFLKAFGARARQDLVYIFLDPSVKAWNQNAIWHLDYPTNRTGENGGTRILLYFQSEKKRHVIGERIVIMLT